MWIRSQNKEQLVDLRAFDIDYKFDEYIICGHSDDWGNIDKLSIKLGVYSTKEKALKVLDIIENFLKNMYIGTGTYMGIPFQMPLDSEVE